MSSQVAPQQARTPSAPSSPAPTQRPPSKDVQLKSKARGLDYDAGAALLAPSEGEGGRGAGADVQAAAERGTAGAGGRLPHAAAIQRAFGRHDVGGIQAQVGGPASAACEDIGASAYASGNRVAFQAAPDLHTAAHEAAHVVQQRAGVQLLGGVGQSGDRYEQHADAVADAVVAGRSAEGLLDQHAGAGGGGGVQQKAAVQAYGGRTSNYTKQADVNSTIPMFTNEIADPQLEGQDEDTKIAYSQENVDHPTMRFADDNTLGIEATKRVDPLKQEREYAHAKDLYLTQQALADANVDLANAGSMVRLTPTGHQITRKGTALAGVKPGIAGEQSAQIAQEMVSLRTDVCIDLATSVMSGTPNRTTNVKLGTGQDTTLARITNTDTESPEVSQLGERLGQGGNGDKDQARQSMVGGAPKTPGQSYGTKLGNGELDQQAQALGINEHAQPDVGEGYATYTMGGSGNNAKTDYSVLDQDQPTERDRIWGYHYAGVVAKSEDGRDTATLENYNRRGDMLDVKKHLLAKLKLDFVGILDDLQALGPDDKAGVTDTRLKEAYRRIENAGRSHGKTAVDMFRDATTVDNAGAWFFAMYGSNPGQSFHEKNAESGYFANPLTVRVTNELARVVGPFKIRFGMQAPTAADVFRNHPAFAQLGVARGAVTTAAETAPSVGDVQNVVGQAMNNLRDFIRQAIWNVMGDLLDHTGVDLPPLPGDFTAMRAELGTLADQLQQKNDRTFTRERSNTRRTAAIQACHQGADYLIKVDRWLVSTLGTL